MSGFSRAQVSDKLGKTRDARVGDGLLAAVSLATQSTDSNQTMTADKIAGGVYYRSGATAARSDTTDTAVNILAQFSNMDIGDTFLFGISMQTAFVLTILAGAGVTLAGKTTVPASGFGFFLLERTGAATVKITGL